MGLTVLASGTVGKLMSLFLYVIPAAMVVTVVSMIVVLCSGKAAPAMTRAIVFINFWVYAAYAAAMLAVSLYYGNIERTFDIVMLAIAGASFLFYLIFSFIKAGKGTWMTFVLFLLTAAFAGVCVYGITQSAQAFKTLFASKDNSIINSLTKGDFYKYAIVALAGIAGLASVISSIRMTTKKGYTFDLIRYLFHVLLAAALVYLAFTEKAFDGTKFYLYAFIALAIAAVQVLLVIVVLCAKKKAKKLAAQETKEAPAEETEAPAETKEEAAEETTAVETTVAEETPADDEIVLTSGKSYSNVFHANGGSASFSVMANTLRGVYGTDVLLATANSFTGSVLQADYNKKMAASMIMPNGLMSRQRTMTGAELKETVRAFVEGCEGGFVPFNRGSLPVASGITMEVKEAGGSYTLTGITRNGQPLRDDDTVTVTCLAAENQMEALLASESGTPLDGDAWVKNRWRDHVSGGGAALAEPENYMTLR